MKLGAEAPVHQRPFSRRRFLAGTAGLGVLVTVGAFAAESILAEPWAYADAYPTQGLPATSTVPEQVHLTWGSDPSTQVTVSWASPGTMAMPAPALFLDTATATTSSPSKTVQAVSYTDGMNLETVHCYHAAITGLAPSTTYSYLISDGGSPANTYAGTVTTAPAGRTTFVFSSVGDVATPTASHNASGVTWAESSDNAYYLPLAIETSAPLFHLLNGDLCYANLNTNNQPEVWRDFGRNNQVSAAKRPWMPCLGNHEIEFGSSNQDGSAATNGHWNGAHGYASYQARYLLPDNGVAGMRGYFYAFQVGTVLFVSLDADDVAFQDGGSYYAPAKNTDGSYTPLTSTNPAISIPPGFSTYNRQYTGALTPQASDDSIVPDMSTASPNEQTLWLQRTLAAARGNGSIDMIIVQVHQCMLSTSAAGNGSDLGIRKAWQPLFDEYSVDLVVNGHDHDYERTYAVRGYDAGYQGTVVAPNPSQTSAGAVAGTAVDTRRPTTITAAGPFPTVVGTTTYPNGFDTSKGTVYLTLGGGGTDGPTDSYGTDAATGMPQAKVITTRNQIYVNAAGNWTRNGADSVEDAPWSAQRDTVDAYGYATFAVDPGSGPGKTTITMTYFHAPQTGSGKSFVGTTSYTPYEVVVFGRSLLNASPPPALPEFGMPAVAAGAALALGGGALYARRRALAAGAPAEPITD